MKSRAGGRRGWMQTFTPRHPPVAQGLCCVLVLLLLVVVVVLLLLLLLLLLCPGQSTVQAPRHWSAAPSAPPITPVQSTPTWQMSCTPSLGMSQGTCFGTCGAWAAAPLLLLLLLLLPPPLLLGPWIQWRMRGPAPVPVPVPAAPVPVPPLPHPFPRHFLPSCPPLPPPSLPPPPPSSS